MISNFYQYISPALRESMEQNPELFGPADQHIPEASIQPYYDQKGKTLRKQMRNRVNGKVILHFDHLRFTEEITSSLIRQKQRYWPGGVCLTIMGCPLSANWS
ncbi:hypothetical protein ACSE3M_08900 [Bacillus velezensis]